MKLYIIGNGFDIAHGIKCKYSDFSDFLGENYPDYYQSIMHGYAGSNALWKDFENELPSCATHIEEWGLEMGNAMRSEIDYDPMDDMGIGFWLDDQYRFLNKLPDYLRLWVESIDIAVKPIFKIERDALFLNFNYTGTLENVYAIDEDKVKHIHGFVDNKREKLVIGHCNKKAIEDAKKKKGNSQAEFIDHAVSTYDRVAKYCDITLKPTERIIEFNKSFFDHLKSIDDIIIIGHSLNSVDMPYFQKVYESVPNTTKWTAYYYNPKDEKPFENALLQLGIRKELVFADSISKLHK